MFTDPYFILVLFCLGLTWIYAAEVINSAASVELKFIRAPPDVFVVKDLSFTWPCDISTDKNNAPVLFYWIKDGHNITTTDRRVVLPNGALYFREIVHRKRRGLSDEGVYRCVARNRIGAILSPAAKLTVAVLPRLTSAPSVGGDLNLAAGSLSAITAYSGGVVRLQCNITGAVPPPRVTWEKNKIPLPQQLIGNKYFRLDSGILHIVDVQLDDAGLYRCISTNPANQRPSPDINLFIQESETNRSPVIVSPHLNITTTTATNITLECLASGWPRPRVHWTRQNGALVLDNRRFNQLLDGSLQIWLLNHADSGIYICHADSPVFNVQYTVSAAINVLVSPVFRVPPAPLTSSLFYGYPLNLQCAVVGQPVPKITWYRNGHLLLMKGRIKPRDPLGAQIEVGQIRPSDAGYYQCFAENEADTIQASFHVAIREPLHYSEPPVNISIDAFSNTTINLRWLTPAAPQANKSFPIIAFSVHYFPVDDGTELQKVVSVTHYIQQRYVINDLRPYTNYSIYIVAYTPQGASEHSKYTYQRTAEGVPSAGPSVAVTPSSPTTMQVDWEPLPSDQANGVIMQYRLVYGLGLAKSFVHLNSDQHRYLLTGLQPGTKYSVRVEASTRIGYNLAPSDKQWPWVYANTPTSIPENAPAPPLPTLSSNQTSVTATWDESDEQEPITEYRLICFDLTLKSEASVRLEATSRSHVFTQLKPGNWYKVTISARNSFGFGREMAQRVQTLSVLGDGSDQPTYGPPIPLPPMGIEVSPVTSSRVRITWSDMASSQLIVGYSILFYMVESHPAVQVQDHYRGNGDVQAAILGDLRPFTEYEIAIQSHTQNAKSDYSKKQRFMTLEDAPASPPADLTGAARRPGTVELHWRPPEHANGIIVSYIIMYNVDDNQSQNQWIKRTHNGSSTSALIEDLDAGKSYFFKLIATTKAGSGPPTTPIRISALCTGPDCQAGPKAPEVPVDGRVDRSMGISMGVGIGLASIVICALILFFKHRYCRRTEATPVVEHTNGDVRAIYRPWVPAVAENGTISSGVEMESYIPMLPALKENSSSDSKGAVVQVRIRPTGPGSTSILRSAPLRQDSQRIHLLQQQPSIGQETNQVLISGRPVSLTVLADTIVAPSVDDQVNQQGDTDCSTGTGQDHNHSGLHSDTSLTLIHTNHDRGYSNGSIMGNHSNKDTAMETQDSTNCSSDSNIQEICRTSESSINDRDSGHVSCVSTSDLNGNRPLPGLDNDASPQQLTVTKETLDDHSNESDFSLRTDIENRKSCLPPAQHLNKNTALL